MGAHVDGLDDNVHYLCNSGVTIEGVKFYGVPMFMADCLINRQIRNDAGVPSARELAMRFDLSGG